MGLHSQSASPADDASGSLALEDRQRAGVYRLLAHFLGRVPGPQDLELASGLARDTEVDRSDFGSALALFSRIAGRTSPQVASEEFHELFIGVGRGELVPYGSYYLTGFLHEKPLSRLRQDMARLGIAADPDVKEPEDHIASLMEMMAGLIEGEFAAPLPLGAQKTFFDAHIGGWAPQFFRDLEQARAAVLYAPLGSLGRAFLEVEAEAFRMI